ncbi:MAG: helix-turn-helix domain-containing protein [bacterium]|nr:helix-turn-helix domain-containing protein [bacterium]
MVRPQAVNPRRRPRQARSRATVARILAAATQVFAEEGYAATTDRIAQRAHLSVGSLYQYFPNKDALVLALAAAHLESSTQPLREVLRPGRPSAVWLPEAVAFVTAQHAEGELHRVFFDQAPRVPELVEGFQNAQAEIARAVAALLAAEFQLADPARTAGVLVALVESLTHRLAGEVPHGVLQAEVLRATTAYLDAAVAAGGR